MSYFTGSDEDLRNILINIKNTRSYKNIKNIDHVMYIYNEVKHINFNNIFDEKFEIHNNPIFIGKVRQSKFKNKRAKICIVDNIDKNSYGLDKLEYLLDPLNYKIFWVKNV
jgi:hypothetical protein